MKFKELKAMPAEELKIKLNDIQKDLIKDNAQVATGTIPKNPSRIRLAKKSIARIKMLLAGKEVIKKA
jgi:ribosomal protein L29